MTLPEFLDRNLSLIVEGGIGALMILGMITLIAVIIWKTR